MNTWLSAIVLIMLGAPLVSTLGVVLLRIYAPRDEKYIALLMCLTMSCLFVISGFNLYMMHNYLPVTQRLFSLYHLGHHEFSFIIENNTLSAWFACVFSGLCAVVGYFSRTYLHRDEGFYEFFFLYPLFYVSVLLVVFSHNFDTLLVGWEIIGLTSVLLIGFYKMRKGPVVHSLYTLAYYKFGDICLLGALTLLHVRLGSASFSSIADDPALGWLILLLIITACLVKSAILPFCSWLPRAMEGPTPSSAVFYGGISTHLGPMLLIKLAPLLSHYHTTAAALGSLGLATALYASAVGRTIPDVKNQLAYATIAQLGVIYAEIGFGYYQLALFHSLAHCIVRTFQFLKAPSLLHDYRYLGIKPNRFTVERFLSKTSRQYLYVLARENFYLDYLINAFLVAPILRCCSVIANIERKICADTSTHSSVHSPVNRPPLQEIDYAVVHK